MPCFALLCAACFDRPHAVLPNNHQALRIVTEARPSRLDPRLAFDAYTQRIAGIVYASLVTIGPSGEYEPYVARRWRWEDAQTCIFDLDPSFAFSDGQPLTADDVAATYRSSISSTDPSPVSGLLSSVADVEIVSPSAVRFRLHRPDAAFLEIATLGILSETQAMKPKQAPDEPLRGAGPYQVEHVESDGSVRLLANPHYPHQPIPIARLWFRVIPDPLTRTLELRNGGLDLVQSAIDPDSVDWLEKHAKSLAVQRVPSSNLQYLGVNVRDPVLADPRVRRAISFAVDREALVRFVLNGQATPAGTFLPPGHWAHRHEQRMPVRSLDRARRLLDEAGLPDPDGQGPRPRFHLDFKSTTDELSRRIGEVISAELAEVGIEVRVRSYEWATFFSDIQAGEFQLYALQWVGISDPDLLRRIYHSAMAPPRGINRAGFADRRIDRWTDKGRRTLDTPERAEVYRRIERRAARLLPLIPLWWPTRIVITSPRLQGFTPHPAGDLSGLLQARWASLPSP